MHIYITVTRDIELEKTWAMPALKKKGVEKKHARATIGEQGRKMQGQLSRCKR